MRDGDARRMGREMMRSVARASRDSNRPSVRVVEMKVVSKTTDSITLDMGDEETPMRIEARMTTACASASAGDTALVLIAGNVPTAIGIIAG